MKVMIVEDEPNAMDRYSVYITAYNSAFNLVAQATTYAQANQLFHQTIPDVIFTDVMIPGKSGLTFLEEIRRTGWEGLAIVISGYGDFSYAQQAIKLSVFDYLLKPVFQKDMEQVLDKILSIMERHPPVPKHLKNSSLPVFVQKAILYIEMNYNREITLKEAADFANVSPTYLCSIFSKKCHMTFVEYLHLYRSKLAAKYLTETDLTLDEIADRVGFGDSSYLNRCFKKQYKISPGCYRKNVQNREVNGSFCE